MTESDVAVLLGFAAAAITLAGFSGIMTSIDRQSIHVGHEVISLRIQTLLTTSAGLILLSLVPVMLEGLDIAPDRIWQMACIAGLATFIAALIQMMIQRLRGSELVAQGFSWWLFSVNFALALVGVGVTLMGALDIIPARGAYVIALTCILAVLFALFHRIVLMADEAGRS